MVESTHYSIGAIRDEARHLLESGSLKRQQPILALCKFFPDRERLWVEQELEINQYLLRDRVCDLVTDQDWTND
jgi:hypothetical protein